LRFDDVRASFIEFVKHKNLLGLDVAQYNPDKDPMAAAQRRLLIFSSKRFPRASKALAAPAIEPAASPEEVSSSENDRIGFPRFIFNREKLTWFRSGSGALAQIFASRERRDSSSLKA